MTDQTTPAAPGPATWHTLASPDVPRDVHITQPGDTLPALAERMGHSGEWRALYERNVPEDQRNNVSANDALPVGLWLRIPQDWLPEPENKSDENKPDEADQSDADADKGRRNVGPRWAADSGRR